MIQRAKQIFLQAARRHPGSLATATIGGFAFAGWLLLTIVESGRHEAPIPGAKKKPMTLEEARLRAMIENAKESSWEQNLDNAVQAQEQFMLPGRPHETPHYMTKIETRSKEIMKQQQEEMEREKKRKVTTRFWS
jgi:hypothetical protein